MKLIVSLLLLTTSVSPCLLPSERHKHAAPVRFALGTRSDIPVGSGDRFENGKAMPIGVGIQNRLIPAVLNPGEINSGLRALANEFPEAKLFSSPHRTYEQAPINGIRIGNNPRVFLVSGMHARERGGPDYVLYFLSDLLAANRTRSSLRYKGKTYTYEQVKTALSAGIVAIPLLNPDGVAYDQATDTCWRKNRNPVSSKGDPDGFDVGVDLNRNFDFLWDYPRYFSPDADFDGIGSEDPASEVFHGTAPMSEPETKTIGWILDSFPSLTWFVDLHSFAGDILYGWGDDNLQTRDTNQNFTSQKYDKKRGITGVDPPQARYREFMQPSDLTSQLIVGGRMQKAMTLAGRLVYQVKQSVDLYPTSGSSTDYVMARWYNRRCGPGKVLGITIEFGEESTAAPCPFYPSSGQFHQWMREVSAGFMELLLSVAATGPVQVVKC